MGRAGFFRGQGAGVRGQGARDWERVTASGCDPKESDLAALESIHRRKTGAMIQVSLRLGAMIAQATGEQMAALDSYGRRIGLAFQITDDLLDVQSSEAATGKRVGKDVNRGKLTFPGLLGIDQSAQYAQQLIAQACRDVQTFGARGEGLRAVAHFVLERNR